jgi:hypothetical protein
LRAGIVDLAVALAALAAPPTLAAQGFLEQFSYEGLHLSGIGLAGGVSVSDRLTTTASGALQIEYGRIAPKVRVVIDASYMRGDLRQSEITRFEQQLRKVVTDPTGDFTIDIGNITWTEYRAGIDLQYVFTEDRIRPYAGIGFGIHIWNGSGAAIAGTFVEDALDTIAAGVAGSAGVMVGILPSLDFPAEVRGEATSELRTLLVRGGLMLRLPHGGAR